MNFLQHHKYSEGTELDSKLKIDFHNLSFQEIHDKFLPFLNTSIPIVDVIGYIENGLDYILNLNPTQIYISAKENEISFFSDIGDKANFSLILNFDGDFLSAIMRYGDCTGYQNEIKYQDNIFFENTIKYITFFKTKIEKIKKNNLNNGNYLRLH